MYFLNIEYLINLILFEWHPHRLSISSTLLCCKSYICCSLPWLGIAIKSGKSQEIWMYMLFKKVKMLTESWSIRWDAFQYWSLLREKVVSDLCFEKKWSVCWLVKYKLHFKVLVTKKGHQSWNWAFLRTSFNPILHGVLEPRGV